MLEERCTEIEKANRILLEKMTNIMNTGQSPRLKKAAVKSKTTKHLNEVKIPNQSLNKQVRQKEMGRIA